MSLGFEELPLADFQATIEDVAVFDDVQMEPQEPDLPFYLIRPPPGKITNSICF